MHVSLTNSRTRRKDRFDPINPQDVRMYLCGPTVYDRAHLGNARPVLVFDVLNRLLRHVYGKDNVTYVRNFTDVDDKINATALARKTAGATGTLEALVQARSDETIAWYHADMDALGAARPDHEPRATEYIAPMVAMIEDLIDKGFAYAKDGHALFRVRAFERYGALSGRSVDDMIAGARVEVAPFKEDPMDFVLWKPSTEEMPGWDSPWGRGRPGWHIECSAMAKALLGDEFDIHGGGNDLLFPHHENELAQSCCANGTDQMAQVWLHNEMLQVEGKKMSKSLGNFFTVRDLLDQGVPGEVIRFVMLSTHYRKPMDWTGAKARDAENTLRKWRAMVDGVVDIDDPAGQAALEDALKPLIALLSDDLNTSGAIAFLHEVAQALRNVENARSGKPGAKNELNIPDGLFENADRIFGGADLAPALKQILKSGAQMLGLLTEDLGGWEKVSFDLSAIATHLNSVRAEAMQSKDFAQVDALKAALVGAGVEVRMSKDGVELMPGAGFDPAKLEGLL